MKNFLQEVLDWSEVWAPLIPLFTLTFIGTRRKFLVPVVLYLWFALIINTFIDAGWKFSTSVPTWMYPNNYLYNIHSIGRFVFFSVFFYFLSPSFRTVYDKMLFIVCCILVFFNFLLFERFYEQNLISSRLFAFESGVLLFYCLRYYLIKTQKGEPVMDRTPDFWMVTGLSVYVVFNFFYFLFYTTLMSKDQYVSFVAGMWNFHNVTFIILCIFIAKAIYVSTNK